jgi:hypothetical protein
MRGEMKEAGPTFPPSTDCLYISRSIEIDLSRHGLETDTRAHLAHAETTQYASLGHFQYKKTSLSTGRLLIGIYQCQPVQQLGCHMPAENGVKKTRETAGSYVRR